MTAGLPVLPEMVVGPVALRVQAGAGAVPPLSLVTVLTRVRLAATSSLVIVQVVVAPLPRLIWPPVTVTPLVHVQRLAA